MLQMLKSTSCLNIPVLWWWCYNFYRFTRYGWFKLLISCRL